MFFNRSGRARFERWPYPRRIARLDTGAQAPDPLAAIGAGAQRGWRMFAADLSLGADGLPQLQGASLDELARRCKALGIAAQLEIQAEPQQEKEAGRVIAQTAARLWRPDFGSGVRVTPPLLISRSPDALSAARGYAPQLLRGLRLDRWEPDWLLTLQQLDCTALVCSAGLLTPGLVRIARMRQLRTLACEVEDEATAQRLLEWGVDGLISGRPELADAVAAAQAADDGAAAPSPESP